MANPYKKADQTKRVPPTRPQKEEKPVIPVVEESAPVIEENAPTVAPPAPEANPLADMIEKKEVGKAAGFYLSPSSIKKVEKAAKQLKCSKSKVLDLLIQKYL